jgi:hypothetical protein
MDMLSMIFSGFEAADEIRKLAENSGEQKYAKIPVEILVISFYT